MKILEIEWKHLEVDGQTCDRCYDTGENLANEIKRLNRTFEPQDIRIELKETVLDRNQVALSNALLFNGTPIEDILDIEIAENFCRSCSDLLGNETYCRTVKYEGNEYEDIPAKAIRHAAYQVLGENSEELTKLHAPNKPCCNGKSNQGCCG